MDLVEVTSWRAPYDRADLALRPGEQLVGGGTWLFSEPQPGTTGLVDLTALDWPPWEQSDAGLRLAATCTVEQLLQVPADVLGTAAALVRECAESLVMSFKIAHLATVGGNVCLALPAGAMTALTSALDAVAVVWTPDGGERRELVSALVTGPRTTSLAPGEVLRAIDVPASSLRQPTVSRQVSLSAAGRSAALVAARRTPEGVCVTVTAATSRPVVLRLATAPGAAPADSDLATALDNALAGIDCWYDDPHGPVDWRRAQTARLAHECLAGLGR